jgi:hypothetical protein
MERIAIHSGKHENITQIVIFSFEEPWGEEYAPSHGPK